MIKYCNKYHLVNTKFKGLKVENYSNFSLSVLYIKKIIE